MTKQPAGQARPVLQSAAEQKVLVRITGGMMETLCAEPAVSAFGRLHKQVKITICSAAADLYVGHPAVSAIMYRPEHIEANTYDQVIDLSSSAADPQQLVRQFTDRLNVKAETLKPVIYVTSMDNLRIERFGLSKLGHPRVAIMLPAEQPGLPDFNTLAADIEERLGGSCLFIAAAKVPLLENGKNLTGSLMPREMAAVIGKVDGLVGFDAQAAALAWAAGIKGLILTDAPLAAPEGTISIQKRLTGRETLLEAVSMLCHDAPMTENE